ncbi:MAG: hypothetical protein LBQ89_08070 [Treponema sp.]|jgi:hypothetical protein|nr:hypothetical protein [Treponema sp.]
MKAILEIELPKNCMTCDLSYSMEWGISHVIKCAALGRVIEHRLKYCRVTDCPLKIVEEKIKHEPEEARIAKFRSDYDPDTILTISMTDDADVVIDIQGNGECRITTSGGQLLGERGLRVIKAFREIIEGLGDFRKDKL